MNHHITTNMNTTNATTCPICEQPATLNSTPNFGRYSAIECPACGQFVVSEAASERIRSLPLQFKDSWRSSIASSSLDKILLIIVEPVGSGSGIKAELVPRSGLRL